MGCPLFFVQRNAPFFQLPFHKVQVADQPPRVMLVQPSLHYYQGYHDVAITFLLVVGEELAFRIMESLSVSHLRQFMAPTMEETMALLELLYPLVQRQEPALHAHMVAAELGTIFALPWLITWFGHVLPDYSDVVR